MIFRSSLSAWLGCGAVAAVLAAGCLQHGQALLNHDVSWLMIAAGRMLAGGGYLRDFFEVNLPLAIAAYAPAFLLARDGHLPWQAAVTVCGAVLALLAALLSAWVVEGSAARRSWLAAGLLAGLLLLPGYDFLQKEHLLVLLGLPFVFAAARAPEEAAPGRPLRLCLSLLAALGFFLKPHYAPLPFLLLALRAARTRSWAPLRSLETRTLLLAGTAYAAVVLCFYPEWLVCARWAMDLYVAYQGENLRHLFKVDGLMPGLAGLALELLLYWRMPALRRPLEPLLACALYALAAYLLQFKGWDYQFLPVLLFTHCGLVLALGLAWPAAGGVSAALLAPALGLLLMGAAAFDAARRMPGPAALETLPQVLAAARPGDAVYVFSFELPPFLPAVPLSGLRWGSRYPHLWPLVRLARAETGGGDPELARLERLYRRPLVEAITEDLRRYRAKLVIVDRRPVQSLPPDYDIAAALAADPVFATAWKDYERIGQVASGGRPEFDIYWKTGAADAAQ
jgi:hypothetical protein